MNLKLNFYDDAKRLTKKRRLFDFFTLKKLEVERLNPNITAYYMLLEEEFGF